MKHIIWGEHNHERINSIRIPKAKKFEIELLEQNRQLIS